MTKSIKYIALALLTVLCAEGYSQTTASSPYSQFGLGDLSGSLLPQNRGMGGIAMGVRKPGAYDNINLANPASYSTLALTTFEIGAAMDLRQLSQNGAKGSSMLNATLSHINIGVPVNRFSAISFGLVPYTQLGYQFKNSAVLDTNDVEYIYGGEGGVSKAYAGYGFRLGKNLSLGFNVGYLFGSLKENRALEFPGDLSAFNSRTQYQNSVYGFSFDYGLQYSANLGTSTKLILGYAGNSGNDIKSRADVVTTRYRFDVEGNELAVSDSSFYQRGSQTIVNMPLTHTVGFAFEKTNNWLIGADVSLGKWSQYSEGGVNQGLNDSFGIAVGGQWTPDFESINNYFSLVDYRLGFKYDKTYINVSNTDIKQQSITFGLGFPLPGNRSSFYKINLSGEVGRRGTEKNGLVRDKFININLGFTLNDRWFQKTYIE